MLPYHADDLALREEMASAAEEAWARAQALHLVAPFPVRAVRFPLDFIAGEWDAAQTYAPMLVEPLSGALAHMASGDPRHDRAVAGKAGGGVAAGARAVTGRRADGTGHDVVFG